ncbi:hypothetical protein MNB_SM-7-1276 [hydrothermal vent metagenome]|uniref:Rod shape-determining protein MreD n=1 Tax=hydrothermal vent metagenome TaxID=652676 RepID=A0A1W1BGD5_9ZZZZ
MQRSLTYKSALRYTLWSFIYIIYASLGTIYLFLPPFIGVLFILFHKSLKQKNSFLLFCIIIDILAIEAQKGFLAFTLLIYFLLFERFIMPKIEKGINSKIFRDFLTIFLVYIGYLFFSALVSQIFLLPKIGVDLYIAYYIVVEFFIVSLFL